ARNRSDSNTTRTRMCDQIEARIADERRTRIRDQRDRLATRETSDELLRAACLVVLVERHERALDAEVLEELPRMTRVFGGDQAYLCENLTGARREIPEIADRGRNHVKRSCVLAHAPRPTANGKLSTYRRSLQLGALACPHGRSPRAFGCSRCWPASS